MDATEETPRSLVDIVCHRTSWDFESSNHSNDETLSLILLDQRRSSQSLHVIHTVGPIYSTHSIETKAAQLASCYKRSIDLAVENSLKHIVRRFSFSLSLSRADSC